MKRAFAREWLWIFGCVVLALVVVGGMRAFGRFVTPATPEHYSVSLTSPEIFTVEIDKTGRLWAVSSNGRAPIRMLPGDEYTIGDAIEMKIGNEITDLRSHSSAPTGGFRNGQRYWQTRSQGTIPLDDLRVAPAPASTDWMAMGMLTLFIWPALYGSVAFVRITSWAIRLTFGDREPPSGSPTISM